MKQNAISQKAGFAATKLEHQRDEVCGNRQVSPFINVFLALTLGNFILTTPRCYHPYRYYNRDNVLSMVYVLSGCLTCEFARVGAQRLCVCTCPVYVQVEQIGWEGTTPARRSPSWGSCDAGIQGPPSLLGLDGEKVRFLWLFVVIRLAKLKKKNSTQHLIGEFLIYPSSHSPPCMGCMLGASARVWRNRSHAHGCEGGKEGVARPPIR